VRIADKLTSDGNPLRNDFAIAAAFIAVKNDTFKVRAHISRRIQAPGNSMRIRLVHLTILTGHDTTSYGA
jgi:hypothetical protein